MAEAAYEIYHCPACKRFSSSLAELAQCDAKTCTANVSSSIVVLLLNKTAIANAAKIAQHGISRIISGELKKSIAKAC